MKSKSPPRIIISNGFARFHLAVASTALHSLGVEVILWTGAYPTPRLKKILDLTRLSKNRKIARLLDREDNIPVSRISPDFISEAIRVVGMMIKDISLLNFLYRFLDRFSLIVYGWRAKRKIKKIGRPGDIYHYRAGFGGKSVKVAQNIGMITLCDHSIAHPYVLEYMVDNEGRWPSAHMGRPVDSKWQYILKDIEMADEVLTISDFVKDTLTYMNWDGSKIHVISLGVDEKFFKAIPAYKSQSRKQARLLFAGLVEKRKGAIQLLKALKQSAHLEFQLNIAGNIEKEFRDELLNDPRVTYLGMLSRSELAEEMSNTDIFVFPTLAEGGARVLFEALACGCYVITTPNGASIVEDAVHGALIAPDKPKELVDAIEYSISNLESCRKIGYKNAELVKTLYRQTNYGENLADLYSELSFKYLPNKN